VRDRRDRGREHTPHGQKFIAVISHRRAVICCLLRHQADYTRTTQALPVVADRSRSQPVRDGTKCLLQRVMPGRSRPCRSSPYRSVTPEVAGSSPVAPVKYLQSGIFCCLARRKRPPASCDPALIPRAIAGWRRSQPVIPGTVSPVGLTGGLYTGSNADGRRGWRRGPSEPSVGRLPTAKSPSLGATGKSAPRVTLSLLSVTPFSRSAIAEQNRD
jgi:hypothetical protein